MKASELVARYGSGLLGSKIHTPQVRDYPGCIATVTQLEPDPNAPEIVMQVHLPGFGSIGVFHHEEVSLADWNATSPPATPNFVPISIPVTVQPPRESWDQYFLGVAAQVARRSTCRRKQVGCLLVRDNYILSTGYGGSVKGQPHCTDECGCEIGATGGCTRTIHAESNAIIQAARHGVSTVGATLYCTLSPCVPCLKMLANAGIKRIVYAEEYRDRTSIDLAYRYGIECQLVRRTEEPTVDRSDELARCYEQITECQARMNAMLEERRAIQQKQQDMIPIMDIMRDSDRAQKALAELREEHRVLKERFEDRDEVLDKLKRDNAELQRRCEAMQERYEQQNKTNQTNCNAQQDEIMRLQHGPGGTYELKHQVISLRTDVTNLQAQADNLLSERDSALATLSKAQGYRDLCNEALLDIMRTVGAAGEWEVPNDVLKAVRTLKLDCDTQQRALDDIVTASGRDSWEFPRDVVEIVKVMRKEWIDLGERAQRRATLLVDIANLVGCRYRDDVSQNILALLREKLGVQ